MQKDEGSSQKTISSNIPLDKIKAFILRTHGATISHLHVRNENETSFKINLPIRVQNLLHECVLDLSYFLKDSVINIGIDYSNIYCVITNNELLIRVSKDKLEIERAYNIAENNRVKEIQKFIQDFKKPL